MWTRFMDMHSGGGSKEKWEYIYIEAPEAEAKVIFYNRFDHNPERITCTCCGDDYLISEDKTLEEATVYSRGCAYAYLRSDGEECEQEEAWKPGKGLVDGYTSGYVEHPSSDGFREYLTLDQYKLDKSVLFVCADEIKDEWRTGDVPEEGYVWV